MPQKLEKKRRVLELGFALGLALTVLLTAHAAHRRRVADRVCADTVRLHILANSDTLEDQLVKLQVRDAILAALPDSVLQAGDTAEAEAALRKHSEKAEASLRTFSERRKDAWVSEIVSGVTENAD